MGAFIGAIEKNQQEKGMGQENDLEQSVMLVDQEYKFQ
jgi:hypothetical protein